MSNEQVQAAIKELQDAMVVMAHMEVRQTDRLVRQEKEIEELSLSRARVEQLAAQSPARCAPGFVLIVREFTRRGLWPAA